MRGLIPGHHCGRLCHCISLGTRCVLGKFGEIRFWIAHLCMFVHIHINVCVFAAECLSVSASSAFLAAAVCQRRLVTRGDMYVCVSLTMANAFPSNKPTMWVRWSVYATEVKIAERPLGLCLKSVSSSSYAHLTFHNRWMQPRHTVNTHAHKHIYSRWHAFKSAD